jgi:hypothetical protein
MRLQTIKILKEPSSALMALGASFIFFDVNYYFMKTLPGSEDLMCVVGANLTTANVIFSVFYSLLAGILIAGVVELFKRRASKSASSVGGITGVGMLLGSLTVFCPACTIPVVSLFGLSFGLGAFTEYNVVFKVVSVALLLGSMYLMEKQLADNCEMCKK